MSMHPPRPFGVALTTVLVLAVSGCASLHRGPGCAPPGGPQGGPPGGPPAGPRHGPPMDPAVAKAFEACAAEQGVTQKPPGGNAPTDGAKPPRLDHEAMEACLRGKGIEPPPAPPAGRPR